ncbi:hypothetical protein Tco_0636885 [Tanacetum coccineum]
MQISFSLHLLSTDFDGVICGVRFIVVLVFCVGIKSLLEVTAAKLMLLVYKLLLLVLKVNAASTKVTTAQRLRLLKEFLLSEENG